MHTLGDIDEACQYHMLARYPFSFCLFCFLTQIIFSFLFSSTHAPQFEAQMKVLCAATLWEVGRVEEANRLWDEAIHTSDKPWETSALWKYIEFKVSQNKVEEVYDFLTLREVGGSLKLKLPSFFFKKTKNRKSRPMK